VKRELITEACATIAFSAIQNNDKVGLILFSDRWSCSFRRRKAGATSCASCVNCWNSVPRQGHGHVAGA
jgi:uncharacterized protein (DUF58 family)